MNYASVCDGIGAAHVAWHPLGWKCEWTSEIDAFPSAVVEQRWGFPNRGDMTKFMEWNDGAIDLLVGGTPCQSFSVAGLRKGMHDPRGGLMLTFLEIAQRYRPRWVVWENVPGVLSSNGGRDFGAFLGALGELGYGWAYRVLDAQWFGVAQRRRRVFVVGCLGDERRAAKVLFESESVRRDNPPSRAKGQGVAGSITARFGRNGGAANDDLDGRRLVAFHPTQDPISSQDGLVHALGTGSSGGCATAAVAFKPSHYTRGKDGAPSEIAAPLSADADKGDQDTVIATPIDMRQASRGEKVTNNRSQGSGGPPGHGVGDAGDPAFTVSERGQAVAIDLQNVAIRGDIAGTLDTTRPSRGGGQAVAFTKAKRAQSSEDDESWVPGEVAPTFNCFDQGDTRATTVVAFKESQSGCRCGNVHATLDANKGSRRMEGVMSAMAVRRLTPRECERLQGFPDDYTAIEYRNKPAADGPRYKALGNSMAVPVMRWIGKRIALVEATA